MVSTKNEVALPRKSEFSNKPDRFLFLFILLTGSLGIIFLKKFNLNQIYVTLFPVFLMVVYFIYLNYSKKYILRDDRAGDNLYYLGFLFTLVSSFLDK